MVKAAIIFGTRPEVIKLAPVYAELRRRPDRFLVEVVSTGQHRDLTAQMLAVFDVPLDVDLALMEPNQSLAELTARALTGLSAVLEDRRPDVILVQATPPPCCALRWPPSTSASP